MKILGLDISSENTGWAVIENGKLLNYGAIPVRVYKTTTKIDNHMLCIYAKEVKDLTKRINPDIFAVENIYVGPNDKTAILLAFMSGIARVIGYSVTKQEIPTIFPSQINKFFKIGRPKRALRKKLIVENVNRLFKLDLSVKEDDIADAISIAHLTWLLKSTNSRMATI